MRICSSSWRQVRRRSKTCSSSSRPARRPSNNLQQQLAAKSTAGDQLQQQLTQSQAETDEQKRLRAELELQIEMLNAQLLSLRQQLARLVTALDASEAKAKADEVQVIDLGKRLNEALANKVEELARYRSEFFGKLREVLGNRSDIQIVGDRFIFQSEVLFDTGSAEIGAEGQKQLAAFADTLKTIAATHPAGYQLGSAGRRSYRQAALSRELRHQLAALDRARHRRGPVHDRPGHSRQPPRRRRLRRIPAAGRRRHRRRLPPQPPHRAEARSAVKQGSPTSNGIDLSLDIYSRK